MTDGGPPRPPPRAGDAGGTGGPEPALLSALVVARNEADQLADCLERLRFADEIVVVLDGCTDGSREVALRFTDRIVEGAWDIEGERRNTGIAACRGPWVLEVDADERVPPALADEIRAAVAAPAGDWYEIPVDNYIGDRLVRHGWGASFGKAGYAGLFRKGAKTWGPQRVHPAVRLTGKRGGRLRNGLEHYLDRDISDMIRRLDRYTTARARDLREGGGRESTARNVRRLFTRFYKCYVGRRGYREGGYGLLIALFAGLYPLLSHLKATLEDGGGLAGERPREPCAPEQPAGNRPAAGPPAPSSTPRRRGTADGPAAPRPAPHPSTGLTRP